MRIEPPPSEACAKGVMRAATAAPEPPLEPPEVRLTSHGLRHGAERLGLGDRRETELGRVGFADKDQPGVAKAGDELAVVGARNLGKPAVAFAGRGPGERRAEILEQERHAGERTGERRARHGAGAIVEFWITALIAGLRASMRAIVSSTRSIGATSRLRTSSASPRPS